MATVEDAKKILRDLGMPKAQQTDIAAYTLLACAALGPEDPWSAAKPVRLRPHGVIEHTATRFQKQYAENTRETIRRQAIHQFVQGAILARNPDDPTLPTNSPRTHYGLTNEALAALSAFGTPAFEGMAEGFRTTVGGLAQRYAKPRKHAQVPVVFPDGKKVVLSPGKHNELQAAVVEAFLPRFAPGSQVLYLGDTQHKSLYVDQSAFEKLGIPLTHHDKLPDVVVYSGLRNWLFLVEAVTSHGPVSPKRHEELEEFLAKCSAGRVYVSAFLNFREFKRHAPDIAWETEVWIADAPDHLLHYNGDRFLGPR